MRSCLTIRIFHFSVVLLALEGQWLLYGSLVTMLQAFAKLCCIIGQMLNMSINTLLPGCIIIWHQLLTPYNNYLVWSFEVTVFALMKLLTRQECLWELKIKGFALCIKKSTKAQTAMMQNLLTTVSPRMLYNPFSGRQHKTLKRSVFSMAWFIRRISAVPNSIQLSAAEMRLSIHTSHLCRI